MVCTRAVVLGLAAAVVGVGIGACSSTEGTGRGPSGGVRAATGTAPASGPATRVGRGGRGAGGGRGAARVIEFPFQDAAVPLEGRVADLLGRMTVEEKAGQMVMAAPAIERLGIPAYHWWNEGLHGVARNGEATVFPQAIGMAATWDTGVHFAMAKVIALEARAKHEEAVRQGIRAIYTGLDMWSPNINIFRDPRWGRGQETYGEDPYLTGRFGVAFVTGLQGSDPFYFQTIATPKHFAVHSGPEIERHRFDAVPSEIDLRTTYLPAFEATVREGKAFSVMAAYNRVDGLPASANPRLLDDILRKEWGFEGYVTSDVDSVKDVWQNHQTAQSDAEAAAMSVKAGCDLNGGTTYRALGAAVKQGLLTEADLDKSVARLFRARFRLGLFDPPEMVKYAGVPLGMNDSRESDALALKAARESIVLLKNENRTLPLDVGRVKTVAVIGPTADSLSALVGNYNGNPSRPVTLLQGVKNAVGAAGGRVIYTAGCPLVTEQIPLEEVVPAECLFTDATRRQGGLIADYYRDIALAGGAIRSRVDKAIDFDWGVLGARDPLPVGEGMSARWSGVIVAPEAGEYQLGVNARDGYRMYLDGKIVVNEWATGAKRASGVSVRLEKGKPMGVVVEYFHPRGEARAAGPATQAATSVPPREDANIQLRWTRPVAGGGAGGAGGLPLFADALRAAQGADAVVMVLGITADLEREEHAIHLEGFSNGDRTSLDLPGVQERMLEAVVAAAGGKPVVLVLTNGSALSVNWAKGHVPAIVEGWYPGQRGGDAVADVIFGKYNPSGRLPVTFYKSVEDLPAFTEYGMKGRTYRYFEGEVLWPFGYGLSYTTFEYGKVEVPGNVAAGEAVVVEATVKNTGAVAGEEVVQVYLERAGAEAQPRKTLVGFARVALLAGEEKGVRFTVTPWQMSVVNEKGERRVEAGRVAVRVGPDSERGVKQEVVVTGEGKVPVYGFVGAVVK